MAFTYINKNSALGKAVQLTGVSAGHLIVAMLQWQDGASTPTLSDGTNAPDGYSTVVAYLDDQLLRFAYWLSSPKSGTVTYTWTSGGVGGHTSHVFEMHADATVSLAHIDAGATASSGDTATSASETSPATSLVAFGGAGWYSNMLYSSATLDGTAVDQETSINDASYGSLGVLTMRVMSNPGTYASVIVASLSYIWCADLIGFLEPGTAALTGTAAASITEADIVAGGKTIILTLTGDTWLPA